MASEYDYVGNLSTHSSVSGVQKRPSIVDAATGYKPEEFLNTNPVTLTRWIMMEQQVFQETRGDLAILLNSLATACKIISNAASKAGIFDLYGLAGKGNASGDDVKKLDVYGNDVMINCLKNSGKVSFMASEENEGPIFVEEGENKYCVVFDPVDGSSNIDANVSVGTIFGIYEAQDQENPNVNDLLQCGSNLICSGYCMYGGATILVLTFGETVNGFTLDPSIGEFIMTHPNLRIKNKGKIYSVNEGNTSTWEQPVIDYVQSKKSGLRPYKARYIGSMVADVHRTLLYGGIFMYPADKKSGRGKLRLVYELNPMAMIIETAGGTATTGRERILSLVPTKIHERRPVYLGSPADVQQLVDRFAEFDNEKEDATMAESEQV